MKYDRIKKNTEFQKIFSNGKRGFAPRLTLLYLPSDGMKMGICVSKKHGKSVKRNRIKRLLREAFRRVCGDLKGGYAIVLIPKQAESYTLAQFEKSMRSAFARENLFR